MPSADALAGKAAAAAKARAKAVQRDYYDATRTPQRQPAKPTSTAPRGGGLPDYAQPGFEGRMGYDETGTWRNLTQYGKGISDYLHSQQQAAPALVPQSPGSGGSGRRGYGGGGGGGGGLDPKMQAATQQWVDSMLKQLASGYFTAKPAQESPLGAMIDPAIAADKANAAGAYNALDAYLQANQANPYAAMKVVDAPQIDPGLEAFIRSQGGDLGAYGHQVGAANAGAQALQANWQNLANAQAANVTNQQAGDRTLSQVGRTQADTGIDAQRTGLQAAVALQNQKLQEAQRAQQQSLDQQKMELIMQILAAARDAQIAMPTIPGA